MYENIVQSVAVYSNIIVDNCVDSPYSNVNNINLILNVTGLSGLWHDATASKINDIIIFAV